MYEEKYRYYKSAGMDRRRYGKGEREKVIICIREQILVSEIYFFLGPAIGASRAARQGSHGALFPVRR